MQMGRHWCPFGFGVGGQLRQDRDEPLSEGKLLQSHGSGRSNGEFGLAAAGRQIVLRATLQAPADYRARPAAAANYALGKVVIDLAGHVALEDSDDFGFGATLFQPTLHIGLGARIRAQAGDHHPQSAELAWRSPPRSSLTRVTLPEEASMGATPQRWAQAASERIRPGLSPAVTRSVAAVSTPTP